MNGQSVYYSRVFIHFVVFCLFLESGMMDLVIVEEGRGDKDADKPSIYDNPGFVDDSMDPKSKL